MKGVKHKGAAIQIMRQDKATSPVRRRGASAAPGGTIGRASLPATACCFMHFYKETNVKQAAKPLVQRGAC